MAVVFDTEAVPIKDRADRLRLALAETSVTEEFEFSWSGQGASRALTLPLEQLDVSADHSVALCRIWRTAPCTG